MIQTRLYSLNVLRHISDNCGHVKIYGYLIECEPFFVNEIISEYYLQHVDKWCEYLKNDHTIEDSAYVVAANLIGLLGYRRDFMQDFYPEIVFDPIPVESIDHKIPISTYNEWSLTEILDQPWKKARWVWDRYFGEFDTLVDNETLVECMLYTIKVHGDDVNFKEDHPYYKLYKSLV